MNRAIREIISIDEDKCDGCGLCIPSCAEGALQIVDGKARLVKDVYCDGLGNCLGECPRGAISIVEREAEPFDEAAVEEHLKKMELEISTPAECGACCGSVVERDLPPARAAGLKTAGEKNGQAEPEPELTHWPVQLHLVAPGARFLQGTDLLIAADCVPFAFADFHRRFLAGRSLVVGCPKLDDVRAYSDKLVEIFRNNNLKSVTLVHMEVGCCFGLSRLVRSALDEAGTGIPMQEIVVGVDGSIKSE